MELSVARQRFYQEVRQPDARISLAHAALYIAQEENPELDPEEYLAALDVMASELSDRLPPEPYPLRIIKIINQYLYDDLGFHGNTDDYYDPRNSFLNDVIDRRTGIPITLSLVYLELARRIGFSMVGIGMPGHFLIRPDFRDAGIFVDAFHQGEILFPEDCEEKLRQVYGSSLQFQPEFLKPVSSRAFLARLLTNLKHIYLSRGDVDKGLAVVERMVLLTPEAMTELRDRGILYYQVGRWVEAQEDLQDYLNHLPDPSRESADIVLIRQLLERMRQRP